MGDKHHRESSRPSNGATRGTCSTVVDRHVEGVLSCRPGIPGAGLRFRVSIHDAERWRRSWCCSASSECCRPIDALRWRPASLFIRLPMYDDFEPD
eukprot:gene26298-37109_t